MNAMPTKIRPQKWLLLWMNALPTKIRPQKCLSLWMNAILANQLKISNVNLTPTASGLFTWPPQNRPTLKR